MMTMPTELDGGDGGEVDAFVVGGGKLLQRRSQHLMSGRFLSCQNFFFFSSLS